MIFQSYTVIWLQTTWRKSTICPPLFVQGLTWRQSHVHWLWCAKIFAECNALLNPPPFSRRDRVVVLLLKVAVRGGQTRRFTKMGLLRLKTSDQDKKSHSKFKFIYIHYFCLLLVERQIVNGSLKYDMKEVSFEDGFKIPNWITKKRPRLHFATWIWGPNHVTYQNHDAAHFKTFC